MIEAAWAERVRSRVRLLVDSGELSALSSIGGTKLLRLSARSNPSVPAHVYAKLEGQNPSGSVKDRIALYLIADALEHGRLTRDTVIVEASSGNTGISLAMVCAVLGYKLRITIADNLSSARYQILRFLGADLELTPGALGTSGAIARAHEIGALPGYLWIAQHYNEVNSFAHYETTGVEILDQVEALGIERLDAFVASSGTTGTLMGVAERLRESFPDIEIFAVWPTDSVMGIRRPEGENMPGIYDPKRIDHVLEVSMRESMDTVRMIAARDGVLLGPSGGAAICGALKVAEKLARTEGRGSVVAIVPDCGERYLSLPEYLR